MGLDLLETMIEGWRIKRKKRPLQNRREKKTKSEEEEDG
jgi:hypothetical protein